MSKGKHSEAQIIAALKQVEAGRATEVIARELEVSKHTIYAWKSKCGGLDVSEAQEVKQLRGRERPTQEAGGSPNSRQGHAAIGVPKTLIRLVERRAAVWRPIEEFPAIIGASTSGSKRFIFNWASRHKMRT